jgi:hypothetical protein
MEVAKKAIPKSEPLQKAFMQLKAAIKKFKCPDFPETNDAKSLKHLDEGSENDTNVQVSTISSCFPLFTITSLLYSRFCFTER